MKDKVLVFIPYQDTDNFYSDGILTREYALLYLLHREGYNSVINIKKPRTYLDKKKYFINDEFYPEGSVERKVKNILDKSHTIQYQPVLSASQLLIKRGWWGEGYLKSKNQIIKDISDKNEYLVYSNNPYAYKLLQELKEVGCKIYFDIMDNFSIHPSLNNVERKMALEGYVEIIRFADYISANSVQTCEFMKKYGKRDISLVKNGVFLENSIENTRICEQVLKIKSQKNKFKKVVGYVGKLGKRLDAELIDEVSRQCGDTLFVFVGPYLKNQINDKLIEVFRGRDNVVHLEGTPSAYVYSILDEFDILMIPHSVGENENGGDPLKLYQYLTRNKPIITTPILGVEEFKNEVYISSDKKGWVYFINKPISNNAEIHCVDFSWAGRFIPILNQIEAGESNL